MWRWRQDLRRPAAHHWPFCPLTIPRCNQSVWGRCSEPALAYECAVDTRRCLRCSCPSRSFPCKHSLALLLRWPLALSPRVIRRVRVIVDRQRLATVEASAPATSRLRGDVDCRAHCCTLSLTPVPAEQSKTGRWIARMSSGSRARPLARLPLAPGSPTVDRELQDIGWMARR